MVCLHFQSAEKDINPLSPRAIAHDPEVFPNPDTFDPQRWIDANGQVRQDLDFCTFGFGRR